MSQRRQPKPPNSSRPRFAGFRSFLQGFSRLISNILSGIKRRLFVLGRERPKATAGFVLPTVIMVMLVVTLLTLTIVFRSFDRAKNASNVRISQATLEAASPAVERATAKLNSLFGDPRLPRSTPSDSALYALLSDPQNDAKFTFDDEVRVQLAYDFGNGNGGNPDNTINTGGTLALERDEVITTAWKYPVDTDNNGKYDSFTVYSILFRTPEQKNDGDLARARSPVEARTRPMDDGSGSGFCAAALNTSAKLVSQGGWYKSGSKLKKSFFVYTATVPITNLNQAGLISATNGGDGNGNVNQIRPRLSKAQQIGNYEAKPNAGFTALEYQQDRARIPLGNFAVVFEDDLAVISSTPLYLNGSIIANSNLFLSPAANFSAGLVRLYQVSAPISCFYQEENSKVFVGGHVINSPPAPAANSGSNTPIHLFRPNANPNQGQNLTGATQSAVVGESPRRTVYNSAAHTARINRLVDQWVAANPDNGTIVFQNSDPNDVKDAVREFNGSPAEKSERRRLALFNHFKNRTRKVPFDEEPQIDPALMTTLTGNYQGTGNTLRPPNNWIFPYDPNNGYGSPDNYADITLNIAGGKVNPPATEPRTQRQDGQENFIGDRIVVGNNLPAVWYDNNGQPVGEEEIQEIAGTTWDKDTTDPTNTTRGRYTQVKILSDVGDKSRSGFWEVAAASQPENPLSGEGGLRIITGAGVYERKSSFLPPPKPSNPNNVTDPPTYDDPSTTAQERFPVVWPDTMPMSPISGSMVYDNAPPVPTPPDWTPWKKLEPYNVASRNTPAASIDPNTRKYAKGDLKMRASAVYHYARDIYDPNSSDNWQRPIACVSSYYDPSTPMTARNNGNLPADVSGEGMLTNSPPNVGTHRRPNPNLNLEDPIGSNNGIVYTVGVTAQNVTGALPSATTGLFPGDENRTDLNGMLYHQANLVYPDGRFVNEPLRKALIALAQSPNSISLASQAAIDSTLCALQILNGQVGPDASIIPHGAIQEVAFLDSKEVKGIQAVSNRGSLKSSADVANVGSDYDNASNDYNLPIEERKPSEVRVTAINLDVLRKQQISFVNATVQGTSPTPEFLLPNSGIIYASRDDALPDISDAVDPNGAAKTLNVTASEIKNSAVDYKLDPTRRANGIMLYNGRRLGRRDDSNSFNNVTPGEAEKGLILVTNNPAYVWANKTRSDGTVANANDPFTFNAHTQEEFDAALDLNPANPWTNFYNRGDNLGEENPDFACRRNDPRLPACTTGDFWRPATIVSDAISFLSGSFRFGYRNEGDFELRNNQDEYAYDAQYYGYNYSFGVSPYDPYIPLSNSTRGKRKFNGFFDNNYVTNGLSSWLGDNNTLAVNYNGDKRPRDTDYSNNATPAGNYVPSSYFNNFVTPIQRRNDRFSEYVMETCRKLVISECKPEDWVIHGYDNNNNGLRSTDRFPENIFGFDFNGDGTIGTTPEILETTDIPTWVLSQAAGNNLVEIDKLGSGTTARPPINDIDRFNATLIRDNQRYPRRVAFARDENNQLRLTDFGDDSENNSDSDRRVTPIPLGRDSGGKVAQFPYSTATGSPATNGQVNNVPVSRSNALWFLTTRNRDGRVSTRTLEIETAHDRWLYYLPPETEMEEFLLPDIFNIPPVEMKKLENNNPSVAPLNSGDANELKTVFEQLNGYRYRTGPGDLIYQLDRNDRDYGFTHKSTTVAPFAPPTMNDANNPADYTFCIGGTDDAVGRGISKNYEVKGKLEGSCPVLPAIRTARQQLLALTPTTPNSDFSVAQVVRVDTNSSPTNPLTLPTPGTQKFTATRPVNVYQFEIASNPADQNAIRGETIILDRGRQENPIFVFQAQTNKRILFDQVTLELRGVNPNNIFWVSNTGVVFDKTNGNNILAGNFLGNDIVPSPAPPPDEDSNLNLDFRPTPPPSPPSPNKTKIIGGRFLGFTGTVYEIDDPATAVDETKTLRNPDDISTISGVEKVTAITGQNQPLLVPILQIQTANGTTFADGNPNLGRNVEDTLWRPIASPSEYNIVFAAGNSPARPGEPDGGIANFANLMEGWDGANYRINGSQMEFERSSFATTPYRPLILTYNGNQSRGGPFNFGQTYKTGNLGGRVPYTGVPNRLFGYDVGLLSQTPDLFSSRFTAPSPGEPDEFFREVGRNDDWVQTLLCAKNAITGQIAINTDQRPQNFCTRKSGG